MERNKTFFESKIQPILEYVGIIGASLTTIAYFIVVYVLIHGFEYRAILETTVFAIVNALIGFIIMQFLKVQGVLFAKNLPENKEILDKYYHKAQPKPRSITHF